MLHIREVSPLSTHLSIFCRNFGSVTTPQLMRLVNDLDKRVYRLQYPPAFSKPSDVHIGSARNPILDKIFQQRSQPAGFGDLADQAGLLKSDDIGDLQIAEDETVDDHHLRLSKTGRKHETSWYLYNINRSCKEGNPQAATELFFHKMLTVDRVMPDVNICHVLLSGLADVGDSENAFRVYRKMTELGIPATNSTYSRLFRACAEDIAAWQREHRYQFNLPSGRELSLQPDLEIFAGPALERAKGLWIRLHERGYRINRITYNTLLQALAKAGDLHACFQALDAMLLGRGGLPPSIQASPPSVPATCSAEPVPPFRPDEYTLNAVLIAIQQSFKSGILTSPLEALRLALHTWHLILPRLPHRRPSLHHFTLLAGIAALNEPKKDRFCLPSGRRQVDSTAKTFLEVIPESLPRLRELTPPPCPRLVASGQAAKDFLRRTALIAAGEDLSAQSSFKDCTSSSSVSSLTPLELDSCSPSLVDVISVDWDSADVIMRSPLNLLLPLSERGIRVQIPSKKELPCGQSYLAPWQRLALLGGLEGFLECITAHFKLTHTKISPLMTKVVGLLPPPSSDTTSELDQWENALLKYMQSNGIVLDLPIFNSLLQRRTTHGLPVEKLMSIATRQGLSPDEFTWSALARGCRTTKEVREFLSNYSKTASKLGGGDSDLPSVKSIVRPSLYIYATLMASTKFYWDSKIVILRSMMGSNQLTSKKLMTKMTAAIDSRNSQPCDSPILPDRRLIANLELDISNFRDLVARGVVPKDGSSVGASDQTGGVIIPPYSLRAFKKFIPIYKEWAEQTPVRG
ncbi:hypothetical protein Aperf_G00000061691 [Anoplocephala perfoliata]